MFANFNKIMHFAFVDFSRNKGISIAAVFILTITVALATFILFFQGAANYLIYQIQDRMDITAYFKDTVQDSDIILVQDALKKSPLVKNVQFVSQEQALANFKENYGQNDVFAKALLQVGDNPLQSSLNIKTDGDPANYQKIADILTKDEFKDIVDSVDFSRKKDVIGKVYSIRSSITKIGLILGVILIIIAILVVFNTIKLTVDNLKEEISTMKIVGASDWFVKGPFMIQGAIYGVIAFVICFVISGLSFYFLQNQIQTVLPGFNSFGYFMGNIWIFIVLQLVFGVGVGMLSSWLAVRKYLKV